MKIKLLYMAIVAIMLLSGCQSEDEVVEDVGPSQLNAFPLLVFPKPHQGPSKISTYCWRVDENDKVSWGVVEKRLRTALHDIGLESTVWGYGSAGNPSGFVVVSSMQAVDENGKTSSDINDNFRQFVLVLAPDVVPTDDRPAAMSEFKYYYEHGQADLPNALADHRFVNTSEGGDHLYLLVYKFHRKAFSPTMDMIDEQPPIDNFVISGFADKLKDQLESQK